MGMRIGFLDCIMNAADVYDVALKIASERMANTDMVRFTSPDVLKIPASAKKLLQDGADVVIAFLTAVEEDHDALLLVYEKIIDVEIQYGKFVFFCILGEDEWKRREDIPEAAGRKLEVIIDLVAKTVQTPSELSQEIGSDAYSAFAQMTAAALGGTGAGGAGQSGAFEGIESLDEGGKPLF